MSYDKRITDIAKIAAEAAAKNARCAPQMLMADITFTLADAVEDGRLILAATPVQNRGEDFRSGYEACREDAARVVDDHGIAWGPAYRSTTDNLATAIRNMEARNG